jgi:hypothetical protein
MGLGRRVFVGATAFVIFLLLLEINSPADRILQAATSRVSRLARNALDVLIANI